MISDFILEIGNIAMVWNISLWLELLLKFTHKGEQYKSVCYKMEGLSSWSDWPHEEIRESRDIKMSIF